MQKGIVKTNFIINNPEYKNPVCYISGGADSDIMLNLCVNCDKERKLKYVWFDAGLEYQATRDHLDDLEKQYGIEILKCNALKSIPASCREYGQPFLSKQVSDFISRLQRHGFCWEDEPYEVLVKKYDNCKSALGWWCCKKGEKSRFNITYHKYLKEFMIMNPPWFKISSKCCKYAKKEVAKNFIRQVKSDLSIIGIRKAEGGLRSVLYKSCFSEKDGTSEFRPIFWFKNKDKEIYKEHFGIENSRCYSEYGLPRTGCAGCPYGRNLENELLAVQKYEPKLYKGINNIFGDSYKYTRMYRDYVKGKDVSKK